MQLLMLMNCEIYVEGGIGDGLEIVHDIRVESRFFEGGDDSSQFECLGNLTRAEGEVNDFCLE